MADRLCHEELRGFQGHRTFSDKTGSVPDEPGQWVTLPVLNIGSCL